MVTNTKIDLRFNVPNLKQYVSLAHENNIWEWGQTVQAGKAILGKSKTKLQPSLLALKQFFGAIISSVYVKQGLFSASHFECFSAILTQGSDLYV